MILHLKKGTNEKNVNDIAQAHQGIIIEESEAFPTRIVTSSAIKAPIAEKFEAYITDCFPFDSDIQLASKSYFKTRRKIKVGNIEIGGDTNNTVVIGGPCSVESRDLIMQSAELMKSLGISMLRGGCYKPRTSPYTFQGLGLEGLKLLAEARETYGLAIVTEIRDATHADDVLEYADIAQIGAKSMYDHGILRKCAKARKPILLKRGFGTTLQEFVQAAEFILSGGNEDVILCERGIRTFETKSRFTLDLCGVAYLKEHTNLPIIADPSHAMGYAYGVPDLTRACMAMGVDGLIIETHPNPGQALSDAKQQLNNDQFKALYQSLTAIAPALGRNIV
jgi:3-deoxy-7-phosphoheptulonate synthase